MQLCFSTDSVGQLAGELLFFFFKSKHTVAQKEQHLCATSPHPTPASGYKMNKSWGSTVQHGDYS